MISKLIVGGAQLGIDYGITNQSGQVSEREALCILEAAVNTGINFVDTARAYGNSEEVIGLALSQIAADASPKIITKIPALEEYASLPDAKKAIKRVIDDYVLCSQRALKVSSLDVVLLHRTTDLTSWDGLVWEKLKSLKLQGSLHSLGVSVQTYDELLLALNEPDVEFIQLPLNILDWRWDKAVPLIRKIKSERFLQIHARSVFLQGLLLTDDPVLWGKANVTECSDIILWLAKVQELAQCSTLRELCLKYVASLDWVDGIVVGVDSLDQFTQNVKSLKGVKFSQSISDVISSTRPILDESTLNPAVWNT